MHMMALEIYTFVLAISGVAPCCRSNIMLSSVMVQVCGQIYFPSIMFCVLLTVAPGYAGKDSKVTLADLPTTK